MLLIAWPLLVANAIALLELGDLIRDLLVGAGIGNLVGKIVVFWREQRGEYSPRWVRRVELSWTGVFVCVVLLFRVFLR